MNKKEIILATMRTYLFMCKAAKKRGDMEAVKRLVHMGKMQYLLLQELNEI